MPILYKKAKQAVDKQYDQLISEGYTPVLNADKETYSWVNKTTGTKYYGTDPTGGIDASAGVGDVFKRNRRQRRLMSEKAGAVAKENDLRGNVSVNTGASSSTGQSQQTQQPASDPKYDELLKRITELEGKIVDKPPVTTVSGDDESKGDGKVNVPGHGRMTQEEADKLKQSLPTVQSKPAAIPAYSMNVGFYDENNVDYTHPYMYVEERQQQVASRQLKAPLNTVGFTAYPNEIEALAQHMGAPFTSSMVPDTKVAVLANKNLLSLKRTLQRDGKNYILVHNPNFQAGLFSQEDMDRAGVKSSNLTNDFDDVVLDGKHYYGLKPDSKLYKMGKFMKGLGVAEDVAGVIASLWIGGSTKGEIGKGAKGLVKKIPSLWKSGKTIATVAKGAETAGQAAAEVAPTVAAASTEIPLVTNLPAVRKFIAGPMGTIPGFKDGGKITFNFTK